MENAIIIGIVIVCVFIGIRSGIKHFKGEGGCCGGGSSSVKKKKLKNVIAKRIIVIEGMSCEHCKSRVERCINDMSGAAARVNLRKKVAVVSLAKEIPDEQLKEAIEKAGYEVIEIR